MMSPVSGTDLADEWIRQHGWKVVPVEDTAHFAGEEIRLIVPALQGAGYSEAIAIATEPVDPGPACYPVPISEEGFLEFNRECGMLRYVLTSEDRRWAISCGEWFNLFAGPADLVEAMLGKPIEEARAEFRDFAKLIAAGEDESALVAAGHYALM
jgi:hypothetical protein